MLSQIALLLKTAFFENAGRGHVLWMDMSDDLDQSELLEGVRAYSLNDCGHNSSAPKRLGQPVANFGSVRFADLNASETARADQIVIGISNGPMNRPALLLSDLGDQCKPFVGSGSGVREWNTERSFVDFTVVEMLDESVLVRHANLG